jgi:4-alpha-glucanotransferase
MALKEAHGGAPWVQWEEELVQRQLPALAAARAALATAVTTHQAMQFFFARQWRALREYANAQGVSLIGDMPIFLAHDSAEVWLHQELFYLDEHGRPTVVAGVPPDYFSATGQLWGNPLYRWKRMAADGYAWWVERIRAGLALMNYVRLDHFRGFQAYWEVPGDATTAANGHWVKGPGAALFRALEKALGELPIIAEDLGLITPAVVALRDQLGLPGMVVLQFAFAADATNTHLPHRWREHCLAYTGTHDNDTTVGWYKRVATTPEGHYARRYLGVNGHDIAWDLVRVALASVATLAIYPAQDLLSLGNEARMNHPSTAGGNWSWRLQAGALNEAIAARLRQMTIDYGRLPAAEESTAESAEGAEVEKG